MAKILVADDNSNIQKMVGLALKDHGIDVVAVGNGEAAVRKISDVRPDLILADVFMPVRNGYEVCKYVKEDSALSHIPVILLVGAFDPLDEQEAQRVGADGVLKKPFVPPDPLISMVKSALVRAGVAHSGFAPATEEPAAEAAPEAPTRVPTLMALPKAEPPSEETESFVEEVPARPTVLRIESGSQPLAFGSLLGNASPEAEEDLGSVPNVHPGLTQERDWRAVDAEAEGEEEPDEAKSSWRRDGREEAFADDSILPTNDWTSQGRSARSRSHEKWTPTREKQDLTEVAEAPETVATVVTDPRSASPAPFESASWTAAIGTASKDQTVIAEAEKESTAQQVQPIPEVTAEHTYVEQERATETSNNGITAPNTVESEQPSAGSSWFSTAPNPWDAEALKASQLASPWEAASRPPTHEESTQIDALVPPHFDSSHATNEIEVVPEPEASALSEAAVEVVREEVSAVEAQDETRSSLSYRANEQASENVDIDAVVAKVLARMKPEVLQEVTREILKPLVEAIVREELSSNKQ